MAETLPGIGPRKLDAASDHAAPPTPEALSSRLAELCRRMGIAIAIHPGLDADAPPLASPQPERYTLGHEIGHGGGGRVLLATDRDLRRSVALKVLAERHAGDPRRVQAFLEEAIITAGLEHPNITPVYDVGWSPTLGFYYTMKRLTGRSLVILLDALRGGDEELGRAFGLSRSLGAFVEICRAVALAHQRGVIHSDLKPDNVMVGEYGEIVLVDWGMAQLLGPTGASQVRAQIRGGTPEYMAPEQFTETGATLGVSVDVWALGVILYELLTLSVPFRGGTPDEVSMRVMIEPVTPPTTRAPTRQIPPGIEQICMRALERDVSRRYPTVAELLGDVEAWLAGTRERMRRAEQVAHALESAEAVLGPIAADEAALDRALADPGEAPPSAPLDARRDAVLSAYEGAAAVLLRGLDLEGEAPALQRLAGDLYWRLFTRIYPSRVRPTRALGDRAIALLAALSQRACASVVQVGQELARARGIAAIPPADEASADPAGSLWLSVARMVATRDPVLGDESAMHSVLARVTSLKEIPLFRAMPATSLLPIAEACREVSFAPGQTIFRQDDPGDTLYVLLEGCVDILRDRALINTLGAGECFGEIAVLGQAARTASAIAVEAVRTLALDAPRFRQIVRESGEIGLAVIHSLNDRLRVATRREAALRSLAAAILAQRSEYEEPIV